MTCLSKKALCLLAEDENNQFCNTVVISPAPSAAPSAMSSADESPEDAFQRNARIVVGGTVFDMTWDEFVASPVSFVDKILSGSSLKLDEEGRIILDRDALCFSVILDFIRHDGLRLPIKAPVDKLRDEARYFGLHRLIHIIDTVQSQSAKLPRAYQLAQPPPSPSRSIEEWSLFDAFWRAEGSPEPSPEPSGEHSRSVAERIACRMGLLSLFRPGSDDIDSDDDDGWYDRSREGDSGWQVPTHVSQSHGLVGSREPDVTRASSVPESRDEGRQASREVTDSDMPSSLSSDDGSVCSRPDSNGPQVPAEAIFSPAYGAYGATPRLAPSPNVGEAPSSSSSGVFVATAVPADLSGPGTPRAIFRPSELYSPSGHVTRVPWGVTSPDSASAGSHSNSTASGEGSDEPSTSASAHSSTASRERSSESSSLTPRRAEPRRNKSDVGKGAHAASSLVKASSPPMASRESAQRGSKNSLDDVDPGARNSVVAVATKRFSKSSSAVSSKRGASVQKGKWGQEAAVPAMAAGKNNGKNKAEVHGAYSQSLEAVEPLGPVNASTWRSHSAGEITTPSRDDLGRPRDVTRATPHVARSYDHVRFATLPVPNAPTRSHMPPVSPPVMWRPQPSSAVPAILPNRAPRGPIPTKDPYEGECESPANRGGGNGSFAVASEASVEGSGAPPERSGLGPRCRSLRSQRAEGPGERSAGGDDRLGRTQSRSLRDLANPPVNSDVSPLTNTWGQPSPSPRFVLPREGSGEAYPPWLNVQATGQEQDQGTEPTASWPANQNECPSEPIRRLLDGRHVNVQSVPPTALQSSSWRDSTYPSSRGDRDVTLPSSRVLTMDRSPLSRDGPNVAGVTSRSRDEAAEAVSDFGRRLQALLGRTNKCADRVDTINDRLNRRMVDEVCAYLSVVDFTMDSIASGQTA